MLGNLVSTVFNYMPCKQQIWNLTFVRTRVKYFFPRPHERKRVTKLGYYARLQTPNGRKIIMRKILKGRHVLGF